MLYAGIMIVSGLILLMTRPTANGTLSGSCLSQWWASPFEVDGVRYATAEHWMMAGKARLFGDDGAADRIVEAFYPDCAKRLGREVRGFDQDRWDERRFPELIYFLTLYHVFSEFLDDIPGPDIVQYASKSMINLFTFGFIISFPILALSLLSDLIFGMLMKTMPQFNLLVVGYPIKITIDFTVSIAILAGMMELFKQLALRVINDLPSLFF